MRLNRNTLLGAFLVLVGFSFVMKLVFGIDFPVFRVAFAAGFIYIGVRLVTGRTPGGQFRGKDQETVAFGDAEFQILEESAEPHGFSVVCGKATIDLTVAEPARNYEPEIEVNVVLGYCVIHYNPARPTWIQVHSFMADVQSPDGNSALLGTINYRTPGLPADGFCMRIRVNAGLSRVLFIPKNPPRRETPSKK